LFDRKRFIFFWYVAFIVKGCTALPHVNYESSGLPISAAGNFAGNRVTLSVGSAAIDCLFTRYRAFKSVVMAK
jgi:hypothetical protein